MNNEQNQLQLTCTVEDIIYRNEQNGYTVLEIDSDSEITTAVGIMPSAKVGVTLTLYGVIKMHPNYGMQFSVRTFKEEIPETTNGILKYLSSGAIKGVGPSTAQRLIENFGKNTLEVIKNEPQRVAKLKGISLSKATEMSSQLNKLAGISELMIFLNEYEIPTVVSLEIWETLGKDSIKKIKENPFVLCENNVLSFERANDIWARQGNTKKYKGRIMAGILHILRHNQLNGHTCLPQKKLIEISADWLEVTEDLALRCLEDMIIDGNIVREEFSESYIFTTDMHIAEKYIANRISVMADYPSITIRNIDKEIEKLEIEDNIKYATQQKVAIKAAGTKGRLILTGGPGTGKTTTLNAIIKLLKNNGHHVLLAAPTGRAAQRMSQLTGEDSKTIHRLLEVSFDKSDNAFFNKNEKNKLKCDAIIIDEVSMVDAVLFSSLIEALPMGTRLILVGDSDQLPSVGAGNVLADLIQGKAMPVVKLNEIFRQSMDSLIVTNAHKIVLGELPDISKRNSDFFSISTRSYEDTTKLICDLVSRRLPKTYGYSAQNDIQVLSPSRKGALGSVELNNVLQKVLNPHVDDKPFLKVGQTILRLGDKVMQKRNNYELSWTNNDGEYGEGVFNGDIGILKEINKSNATAKIEFDNKTAMYPTESLGDIELAYATTVHKSQGNEFEAVIIPMFKTAPGLLNRNLLYTAVTRAKKMLILVGDLSVIEIMVNNNKSLMRYTGLKYFLENNMGTALGENV